MFPNKWVIFWNDCPTGLTKEHRIFKVDKYNGDSELILKQIKFWDSKREAQDFIDYIALYGCIVKEIQFKIVG